MEARERLRGSPPTGEAPRPPPEAVAVRVNARIRDRADREAKSLFMGFSKIPFLSHFSRRDCERWLFHKRELDTLYPVPLLHGKL